MGISRTICPKSGTKRCKKVSVHSMQNMMNAIDTVISDCDGVLYCGETPIPGARETLMSLVQAGKKVYLMTNDVLSRKQLQEKVKRVLGLDWSEDRLLTSAYCAAAYLKKMNIKRKRVYVFGKQGIADELTLAGFECFGVGPELQTQSVTDWLHTDKNIVDPEVGAVVLGLDEELSYPKITRVCSYANDRDVAYICPAPDKLNHPAGDSNVVTPGPAGLIGFVEAVVGRKPIIVGKPSTVPMELLADQKIVPERTLMIGDSLGTDMAFAVNCNLAYSLLTMSGATTHKQLAQMNEGQVRNSDSFMPTYHTEQFGDLNQCYK